MIRLIEVNVYIHGWGLVCLIGSLVSKVFLFTLFILLLVYIFYLALLVLHLTCSICTIYGII